MPSDPTVKTEQVPLSRPDIGEREIAAVCDVLGTPQLSLGPRIPQFEQAFAEMCGVGHGVAVSSGTAGLHVVLHALGLPRGAEVITTPFSFVASANCILYVDGKPVFADIDPRSWNIDPDAVEDAWTGRTAALIPVHVFGRVADMPRLNALAGRHGVPVVEDACEAPGSSLDGRVTGSMSHAGVFGFYPNKQITTGEGGMVVTDDADLAAELRSLRNQGRSPNAEWLEHDRLGWNFRIPDILCALGLVQLQRLEEFIQARQRVVDLYAQHLGGLEEIELPAVPESNERVSWFVYVIAMRDGSSRERRNAVLEHLRERGIGCRNYFSPIHLQPLYREKFGYREGMFPVTESVADRTIALPFFNRLDEGQIARVAAALRDALDATRTL